MDSPIRISLLFSAVALLGACDRPDPPEAVSGDGAAEVIAGGIESRPLPLRKKHIKGETLFQLLDAGQTGLDFGVHWKDPASRLKQFLFLNPVGGICAGDYDGDGLPDLYITSPDGGNRLYRNLGGLKFEDATVAAGVNDDSFWGTGASFVDIDNDGDLDLFACGYECANKLYVNEGQGHFVDRAKELGLAYQGGSMMMSFADIDNDGDLDGYLATTAVEPPAGTQFQVNFVPRKSDGVEVPVVVPELREYWEILYLGGDKVRRVEAAQYDHLYRNDGGKFVDVSKEAGIEGAYFSLSATWFDYDGDGDSDLYVSNDFTGPDFLYRNRGDGTFENVIKETVPHTPWFSMGSDVGDLNNDGLLDLMAADMSATSHYREKVMMGNMDDSGWFLDWAEPRQYMRNAIYLNAGVGRFYEASFLAGLSSTDWTWTPRIEDFDQDGRSDVFVTNGVMRDNMNSDFTEYVRKNLKPGTPENAQFWLEKPMLKEKNLAFQNLGDLKFQAAGMAWGLERDGVSFGAVTADFDGDGDPDLVVSNADCPVSFYRNDGSENHRLAVSLVGRVSNRNGLGATILVTTKSGLQTRMVTSARGWLSASDTTAFFGLGEEVEVERLEVRWPGGTRQVFENLAGDQFYTISEAVGQEVPAVTPVPKPLFVESSTLTKAVHEEVIFDDFKLQPLLPNRLSQQGPGMAWGDIDGDGDDDFFLGGASGQSGQMFVNEGGGKFVPKDAGVFAADSGSEDHGLLFFDCEGDGDLDLYVAHGGVEHPEGDPHFRDRLFLNDGKGDFSAASMDDLADAALNSGPVVAADFDRDGDLDLFVGGRSIPGRYPLASRSRLLVNSGGKFMESLLPDLGMVTGAICSDANGDGWVDLLITIEWGPVRFLRNEGGALVERTRESGLEARLGWWNGIAAGDLDGDGDIDYLVTNYGLNTKYKASPEKPEMIYYGDFDGSGTSHILEAKLVDGKLLPRRGFSCSKSAMPSLQQKVGTFHNFASSALVDLYSESRLGNALRLEVNTLESGILINDGTASFSWQALPRFAQISPAFGAALADLDGDGDLDAVLAQNSFSPQRETGRMDGGLSLVLSNDGKGQFSPMTAMASGVIIPGDAKSLTLTDLDGDARPDLVFGMNNAPVITYLNKSGKTSLNLKLSAGSASTTGAKVQIGTIVRELNSGGSYLSQSSSVLIFPIPESDSNASVRWPDGTISEHSISLGTQSFTIQQPGS